MCTSFSTTESRGGSGAAPPGMASLATSQVVAVREFGLGSAIGVMVDFAISLVLVPPLLGWLRPAPRPAPQQAWFERPMRMVAGLTTRHATRVIAIALVLTIVSAFGLTRLHVDTNHINFFRRTHPLSESALVIDGKLSGIYAFQIFLEGPPDAMKQPDLLNRMG